MIGLWSDCRSDCDRIVIGLLIGCDTPPPRTSLFESVFGGARIFSKLKTPATLHFCGHCFAHFVLNGGAFAFGANAAVMATQEGCCWLWALVGCGAQNSFSDWWAYMGEPFHLRSKQSATYWQCMNVMNRSIVKHDMVCWIASPMNMHALCYSALGFLDLLTSLWHRRWPRIGIAQEQSSGLDIHIMIWRTLQCLFAFIFCLGSLDLA